MKVEALRAPKQEALTINARTREPIGPKTLLPNTTATVLEELRVDMGSTKKYAAFAMM